MEQSPLRRTGTGMGDYFFLLSFGLPPPTFGCTFVVVFVTCRTPSELLSVEGDPHPPFMHFEDCVEFGGGIYILN